MSNACATATLCPWIRRQPRSRSNEVFVSAALLLLSSLLLCCSLLFCAAALFSDTLLHCSCSLLFSAAVLLQTATALLLLSFLTQCCSAAVLLSSLTQHLPPANYYKNTLCLFKCPSHVKKALHFDASDNLRQNKLRPANYFKTHSVFSNVLQI